MEDPELLLGDETTKIFLNSAGTMDDVPKDLKEFLDYVSGKNVTGNQFVDALDSAVQRARADKKPPHPLYERGYSGSST